MSGLFGMGINPAMGAGLKIRACIRNKYRDILIKQVDSPYLKESFLLTTGILNRPLPRGEMRACVLPAAAAAAAARHVPLLHLSGARRGRARVAKARQLAIYLHHVALGQSLSACARDFSRDRATVRHACARIEDARDDARFDAALSRLEIALQAHRRFIDALGDSPNEGARA